MRLHILMASLVSGALTCAMAVADRVPKPLEQVHRIAFLGDSITQAGDYVVDMDCWLVAHGIDLELINLGLGSETATDLTEAENAGHKAAYGFGRPALSERLERVLKETHPDVLIACYGMNDGGSLPEGDEGLHRYSEAIIRLRDAAMRAGVAQVVLCTPPVHDAKGNEAQQQHDRNLSEYSKWLISKKADGWLVVDIHGPMRNALDSRRKSAPDFAFAADGVHPGREGHWLMASAILAQYLGVQLEKSSSAESLFSGNGDRFRTLVQKRMTTRFRAWMSRIGHNRPGVAGGPDMTEETSFQDAMQLAETISQQIRELRSENGHP